MHYTKLATDWSNEIHVPTFWCYYGPHGNTTRMSNDPQVIKKEKRTTPVTKAPVKASLKKTNRKVKMIYRQWLDTRKLRKQFLKIPEVIFKGEEKEYMFRKHQEAEVENWEKKQNEEKQRQL